MDSRPGLIEQQAYAPMTQEEHSRFFSKKAAVLAPFGKDTVSLREYSPLHHPILEQCDELLRRKSEDYQGGLGESNFSKSEYHPFGHKSYQQMLHTKLTRIKSVSEKMERGEVVNFESLKDSVMDLINYAAFYGAWLDEENERS